MAANLSPASSLLIKNARTSLESSDGRGVGTTLKRARIDKAIQLFTTALAKAHTSDLSTQQLAKQGLVECYCKHIAIFGDDKLTASAQPTVRYNVDAALEICDPSNQTLRYLESIVAPPLNTLVTSVPANSASPAIAANILHHIIASLKRFKSPSVLALGPRFAAMHSLLELTHHEAVRAFEAGHWAKGLNGCLALESMIDEYASLEASVVVVSGEHGLGYLTRADTFRTDWNLLIGVCRASQLLQMGDKHWEEAQRGLPEDLYARSLLAQDDYRAALSYATEQDVELEGTVLTRLARFHDKVAKLPVVAHQLYLRAVQLAASLSPALPKGGWYTEATAAVQRYRDALAAQEAQEWQEKRKPILEKLKDELDKLENGRSKSNREFCEYVFKNWPPKTPGFTELPASDDPNEPNMLSKKLMVKVIARYHTDKNSQHGEEWLVLCEEISKALTARYNIMKGVD